MRIIDLVEKQRHNEILPKHIKYENENLYFDGVAYFDKKGNKDLLDILAIHTSALTHLYDEVEIIEEDKEIKKLDYCEKNTFSNMKETTYLSCEERRLLDSNFKTIKEKFDELIDEVNRLKNKE